MISKLFAVLTVGLALTACQKKADEAPVAPPTPVATATVTVVVPSSPFGTPVIGSIAVRRPTGFAKHGSKQKTS